MTNPLRQTEIDELLNLVGPARLRYCPLTPTARQEAFLRLQVMEALYGGAAGGGKSVAMLMSGSQYVDVPGYNALLVRTTLSELEQPGGLIDLSHQWFGATKAVWSNDMHVWRFPGPGRSGAGGGAIWFGYLDGSKDLSRYSGGSYTFLGLDELSGVDELTYRRMFRAVRRGNNPNLGCAPDGTTLADVPVRIRATANPGGPNQQWIRQYFVDPASRQPGVVFLAARWKDNHHLDLDDYLARLALVPSVERERLVNGNWEIADDGDLFRREWFTLIDRNAVPETKHAVRYWDLAATEPSTANPDPDYTVGLRLDLDSDGVFYITDIVRARVSAGKLEQLVRSTAEADGDQVAIVIEQEPGASGVQIADRYKRHILRGYNVRSERPTGSKEARAQNVAAAAENGFVKLVAGRNSREFLDETASFPNAPHDDCVDAVSGAHRHLAKRGHWKSSTIHVPRGNLDAPATSRPRTAAQARALLERRDRETATLAAQLGLPFTPMT